MSDSAMTWTKARRCHATTACVELANVDDGVAMRNSLRPDVVVQYTSAEFAAFLEAAKNGEFDHLVSAEPAG